ncbi:hypothetical protein TNCV_2527031 [Trichonephila clavipes]|nr:hypothetical protein TNCV_2527031 [Trichonephila clavipes]
MHKHLRFDIFKLQEAKLPVRLMNTTNEQRNQGHETTSLRVKGDIEDVSTNIEVSDSEEEISEYEKHTSHEIESGSSDNDFNTNDQQMNYKKSIQSKNWKIVEAESVHALLHSFQSTAANIIKTTPGVKRYATVTGVKSTFEVVFDSTIENKIVKITTIEGEKIYTRVFGDGPRNFEPWSSDMDDHTPPTGGRLSSRQIERASHLQRRVFSGTGLELVTRQATIRYLDHSTTAATHYVPKRRSYKNRNNFQDVLYDMLKTI